jgi:hypothetical protein
MISYWPGAQKCRSKGPRLLDLTQHVEAHPTVAAMTYPDLSNLQVVGGGLLLAGLFVLREITSGALNAAGKELWVWARERRSRGNLQGRRR